VQSLVLAGEVAWGGPLACKHQGLPGGDPPIIWKDLSPNSGLCGLITRSFQSSPNRSQMLLISWFLGGFSPASFSTATYAALAGTDASATTSGSRRFSPARASSVVDRSLALCRMGSGTSGVLSHLTNERARSVVIKLPTCLTVMGQDWTSCLADDLRASSADRLVPLLRTERVRSATSSACATVSLRPAPRPRAAALSKNLLARRAPASSPAPAPPSSDSSSSGASPSALGPSSMS